jgi:MFS family permease
MDALIIGRAICGIGGSGMYVGVMTLLAATTTIHERPMYVGSSGLTWGLGTVLGPIIGGGFSDSQAGWRWAFYINLYCRRWVECPSPSWEPVRPICQTKASQKFLPLNPLIRSTPQSGFLDNFAACPAN